MKQLRVEQGGEKHQATKYDRFCFNLSESEVNSRIASGEQHVIRMLVPQGISEWRDMIHGKVVFNNNVLDDQILLKSDGYPTYHFANVVDDHLMNISHVIRGEVSLVDLVLTVHNRSGSLQPPSISYFTNSLDSKRPSLLTCLSC